MKIYEKIIEYVAKNVYSKKENEVDLDRFKNFETISPKGKLYAVDGGSGIISDCGSYIISKIKIGVTCYENSKRVSSEEKTDEYYVFVQDTEKGLKVKSFPDLKLNELKELKLNRCKIDEVQNEIRKFLERKKIEELSKKISENDLILGDGYFERIKFKENVVFICKTSRLRSKSGRPLIGYLNQIGKEKIENKKWMYSISENEYIVKFHGKGKFCYKVNVKNPEKLNYFFGVVAHYSKDPELIGYPYPLLRVDKIARIRNDEKKTENRKLKNNKFGNLLRSDEDAAIMHELLDKRMYR